MCGAEEGWAGDARWADASRRRWSRTGRHRSGDTGSSPSLNPNSPQSEVSFDDEDENLVIHPDRERLSSRWE